MEYSPMALSHTMDRVTHHNPSALPSMASCATETVRRAKTVRMLSPLAVRCREMLYEMQAYKTAFVGAFDLFMTGDLGPNIQIHGFVNALQIAEVMYEDLKCRDSILQFTYRQQENVEAAQRPTRRGIREALRSFVNVIRNALRRRRHDSQAKVAQFETEDSPKHNASNTEATHVETARTRRGYLARVRHSLSRLCSGRRVPTRMGPLSQSDLNLR